MSDARDGYTCGCDVTPFCGIHGAPFRTQAEGGTVPRVTSCPDCGTPEGAFHYRNCPRDSTATWHSAAPRASEGKHPSPGDQVKLYAQPAPAAAPAEQAQYECASAMREDADALAAAPDAELIAEIDAWIYRRMQDGSATSGMALLSRCRERLAQPAITDAEARARYWQETAAHRGQSLGALHAQIERKDKALRKYAMHGDDCRCWAGTVAAPIPCTCGLDAALGDTQEGM